MRPTFVGHCLESLTDGLATLGQCAIRTRGYLLNDNDVAYEQADLDSSGDRALGTR